VEKSVTTHYHITKLTPNVNLTRINNTNVLQVTVDGNATGNVTFIVNGYSYTVNLTDGKANLTGKLAYGNNNVIVNYNPDENHTAAGAMANFTVDKLNPTVNVTANNTVYGNDVTVIVQVGENHDGYVTITVNGEEQTRRISGGKAVFTVKDLEVGNNYRINVTYDGNYMYMNGTNYTYFNVTPASMSAVVTAKNVTVEENPSFVIDGLAPRDFEGKVKITIGDDVYYDNIVKSVIEIEKILKAGNYTANVTFYGNKNYANSSYLVNFTVSRTTPDINVTIDNVVYPNNAFAIVNISNNANGTVKVYINGNLIGEGSVINGTASINLTKLSAGDKEVTVEFITSDDYNNNVSTIAGFKVIKANSTVELTQNGTDVIATVTTNATGIVTFYINGKEINATIVNGSVTVKGNLTFGNNTVVAFYNGDVNFTESRTSANYTIDKHITIVDINGVENITYSAGTSFTINVTTNSTGIINLTVNGKYYPTVNNSNVDLGALDEGHYIVTAVVYETASHTSAVKTIEFTVAKNVAVVDIVGVDNITYHSQ
jgi:hypothetical protein